MLLISIIYDVTFLIFPQNNFIITFLFFLDSMQRCISNLMTYNDFH